MTVEVRTTPPEPGGDAPSESSVTAAGGRGMAANVVSLGTSQLITWTLTLLWTLIVPRLLGPAELGILIIAQSVTGLAAVALSTPPKEFLVREMVANRAGAPQLLTTSWLIRLCTFPLLLVIATVYGRMADMDSRSLTVLYLVAVGTLCTILIEPAVSAFQATERMQYIAYNEVANKTLQTFGAILLVLAGFGVVAVAGLSLAISVFALGLALVWVHRIVGIRARPAHAWSLVRRGAPYWAVSLGYVAYLWADALILGLLVPAEVVGWYGAATRLFTTSMFVAVIIATASLPRLVASHAETPERLIAVARQPFEWVLMLGLPIGVGLAVVAEDAVPLLYGDAYLGAVAPLVVLGLCLPVMYANIMINQLFVASGRPFIMAALLAFAAVVNIAANLVLIPYTQAEWGNGGTGAALALLLAEVLQLVLGVLLAGRHLLSRHTLVRITKAAVAAAVMGAVVLRIGSTPLPVQVVVGVLTFGAVVVLLRLLSAGEWQLVLAMARRLVGRVRRRQAASSSGASS